MSMNKPGQVYPSPAQTPASVPSGMPLYLQDPSIKGNSFDQLLNQRGVRFIHKRVAPCPNIKDIDSNAHEPDCEFCDNDGFIHYDEREITGVFSGNSIEKTFEAHGIWETGTAVVTFPTVYVDGTEADFNTFDYLLVPDFEVRLWELKEYEPRTDGVQDLRYPVVAIDYVSSIRNGVQKFYELDVDFTLNDDGQIVWVAGKEPFYDTVTGHGEVIAWAFYAKPVYRVVQNLRELRITQELINGQKVAKRLPQQVLVKRDFLPGRGETPIG